MTTEQHVHNWEYNSIHGQAQHWECSICRAIGYGDPGAVTLKYPGNGWECFWCSHHGIKADFEDIGGVLACKECAPLARSKFTREQPTSNPRLAKLIAQARGSSGPWFDELVAEIERLRAALEEIATGRYGDESCIRKAREALAGAPSETTAWRCPKCEGTKFHYAEECPAANGEGGL